MRTIADRDDLASDVERLKALLTVMGRKRSLRDPVAAAVEELGLTPPQVHALLWLGSDGPMTMGEIAHRCGISEKTITGIIDRLEKSDLLQRERDESDRRVVRCRLTKTGEKVARKLDALVTGAMTTLLGLIDGSDRKHLLRIFEKLQQALSAASEAAVRKDK